MGHFIPTDIHKFALAEFLMHLPSGMGGLPMDVAGVSALKTRESLEILGETESGTPHWLPMPLASLCIVGKRIPAESNMGPTQTVRRSECKEHRTLPRMRNSLTK